MCFGIWHSRGVIYLIGVSTYRGVDFWNFGQKRCGFWNFGQKWCGFWNFGQKWCGFILLHVSTYNLFFCGILAKKGVDFGILAEKGVDFGILAKNGVDFGITQILITSQLWTIVVILIFAVTVVSATVSSCQLKY